MKMIKPWFSWFFVMVFFLAGCHEIGHIEGPVNPGNVGSTVVGEVQYVDTRTSTIELRTDGGRTTLLRYDANTRVLYQNRTHPVSNLEPGDYVSARAYQERDGRLFTDQVSVNETAQNRSYGGTGITSIRGTVTRHDLRANQITIETPERRQLSFSYDGRTRVRYRNRDYPIQSVQVGDVINYRPRDRQPVPVVDSIAVLSTADDRARNSATNRLDRIDGVVEYVDARRGQFDLRDRNNRIILVNLQTNPPRAVSDRFGRLKTGETVRVEGHFINQERFEMENFY